MSQMSQQKLVTTSTTLMHIDKIPRTDRRGRFIAAHRRFIGQSLSGSFVNIHQLSQNVSHISPVPDPSNIPPPEIRQTQLQEKPPALQVEIAQIIGHLPQVMSTHLLW
jgi:hypothetical protein